MCKTKNKRITWILGGTLSMIGVLIMINPLGCATTQPAPVANNDQDAIALTSLDEDVSIMSSPGARLWAENCIRCHNYRKPASLSDREWQVVMHHMRVRANLTSEEHESILRFLQAAN